MNADYQNFLLKKAIRAPERGLDKMPTLAKHLFPFQRHCVEFALRVGTAGCFLDTGLGKTEIQLEWCKHAAKATNGRALILTPLAVAGQTKRRADKWGYTARVIREQADAGPGINILNYDRLDKIDPTQFGAVSLDEASILKSFTGKTTRALIEMFKSHRFRLAATATPAPNDHMELGNHAEFLGIMAANEMLSRFFINDTSEASQQWRLKGHAVGPFWDWMSSWSRMAELPSDLGDTDDGFVLPPFKTHRHKAIGSNIKVADGDLFGTLQLSATNLHQVKRETSEHRAAKIAEIVASAPGEPWLIWCDTDYEADTLKSALPGATEVRGSMPIEMKEEKIEAFGTGKARILIGKPSMLGFGLDWSHCARMAFVGRSYSYETFYQAVRRCWRFGQKRELQVHIVVAEGEAEIGRVIDRKADDHALMKRAMREAMRRAASSKTVRKSPYDPKHETGVATWLKSVV
jgi:superfamily II DNA or RNA helicase